jgi:hypothetical protein
MSDQYIAGSCNIGKEEIRRRKSVALLGAIATILGAISIINKYQSASPRLWLFIPAMVFATGWIQSKKKFCLAYGYMGVFNFGKAGAAQKVRSKEERDADRATAFSILTQAVVLAFAITGLIYFLPA